MIGRYYFTPYEASKLLTISIQVYEYHNAMISNVTLFNCFTHC